MRYVLAERKAVFAGRRHVCRKRLRLSINLLQNQKS